MVKKFLSYILSPIFYLFFGLILVVFHPFLVIARFVFGRNAMDRVTTAFNFSLMRLLWVLGTSIKFVGFKKLTREQPIVILSNHQSMWDVPALMWKFKRHHPKFIVKEELSRFIPSVSFNVNHGGSVAIDRSKPTESLERIREFAKMINDKKYAVCIFPEGTRTMNGPMKPFKKSGIESILKEIPNALFIPVAIKNTGKIDWKGKLFKAVGIKVTYTFLEPRNLTLENVETELSKIRDEIISTI
ncbi:MAG: 1-acyl-sn-glycerol-3-phosphate acyltransferase, partial [Arenicella sp.]